jgi:hypothetical protein
MAHLLRSLLLLAITVAALADKAAHDGRDDSYKPANWKAVRDPLPPPTPTPVAALNTTGCQTVLQVREHQRRGGRGRDSPAERSGRLPA